MTPDKDLKPCPQCGSEVKQNKHKIGAMCTACGMDLYDDYGSWWCYKTISRSEAEVKRLREAAERVVRKRDEKYGVESDIWPEILELKEALGGEK